MAVASIAVPPDPKRDARARALAPFVGSWPKHTLKVAWGSFEAGTTFRRATGSCGEKYLVNAIACECPDYQQAGNICKHFRAIVLWEAGQQPAPQPAPAPRVRYEDIFHACAAGCGDLVGRAGQSCYRCSSDRDYQAPLDAKRARVA
jgi:hypothetical protein